MHAWRKGTDRFDTEREYHNLCQLSLEARAQNDE